MKIIISGFHDSSQFKVIYRICKDFNVSYVVNVFSKRRYKLPAKTEFDAYEYEEVLFEADYGTSSDQLLPLTPELVVKMRESEAVVLNMINRMEVYKDYSYEERKKIYLKHLRFWNHIIETKKINLFISSNVPHIPYSFVAYELCRLKKIPTIIFKESQISDSYLMFDDWKNPLPKLPALYNKYLKENFSLSNNFLDHYKMHATNSDTTPFYMKKKPFYKRLFNWIETILSEKRPLRRWKYGIRYLRFSIKSIYKNRILSTYYSKLTCQPDYSKQYIYFPLHMQPEMTTSPCADSFVDQYLAISVLSHALPKNIYVYVKENPKQGYIARSKQYYKELAEINNVKLISKSEDTIKLIMGACATATATGTAGWESILRGKPTVIFGYEFYQDAPGVLAVRTSEDLKEVYKFIKSERNKPSSKKIKAFLKALEDLSITGFVDPFRRTVSKTVDADNEKGLYTSLSKKMISLGFKKNV